jgi:hypothetical protein
MLRIPHCIDIRLKYADEVVSLTQRPYSTPKKRFSFLSLVSISVRVWPNVAGKIRNVDNIQ